MSSADHRTTTDQPKSGWNHFWGRRKSPECSVIRDHRAGVREGKKTTSTARVRGGPENLFRIRERPV